MKTSLTFLILFVSHFVLIAQNLNWNSLSESTNHIGDHFSIKMNNIGILKINTDTTSIDLKENDVVLFSLENGNVKVSINDTLRLTTPVLENQINIKFNDQTKKFKFADTLLKKPSYSNETDNSIFLPTLYYDAILLNKAINMGNEGLGKIILTKYNIEKENNFFETLNSNYFSKSASGKKATDKKEETSILSTIGGLDVTKYADGLAKFLVKRAKNELSVAYFSKFKETLESNENVSQLFPSTYKSLQIIGDEIYNYNQYIKVLQENFLSDFQALPENFKPLIEKIPDPSLKSTLLLSSKIISGYRDKQHPSKILSSFTSYDLAGLNPDIRYSIIIAKAMSEALKDTSTAIDAPYWIDKDAILSLMKDVNLLNVFTGLLISNIKKEDEQLYNILNTKITANKLIPLLTELSGNTQRISTIIKNNDFGKELTKETISNYVDASFNLIGSVIKLNEILNYNGDTTIIKFLDKLKLGNSLYKNIVTAKYSSAIYSCIELFECLEVDTKDKAKSKEWLMKYGSFMAAMIDTENSDDVEKIIETYALPSGSSRVKRNSACNISLNAFLGAFGGYENEKLVYGISAPVGLAISTAYKRHSLSLFLSAIDIGAISAFRFGNDTSQIATIYLKEIISPGAFISWGISNSPISINLGIQSSPLLKRVGTEENKIDITHRLRYSLSVLVDIPLMNLYNKK